jgi:transcriptional regulator with XRE-family HTH domain
VSDFKAALARGETELLTSDEVKALLEAPTPLAFWRRKRKMRQGQLAEASGFAQGYISDIENGRRRGGIKFYRRLVPILGVPLESLLPPEDDGDDPQEADGRA